MTRFFDLLLVRIVWLRLRSEQVIQHISLLFLFSELLFAELGANQINRDRNNDACQDDVSEKVEAPLLLHPNALFVSHNAIVAKEPLSFNNSVRNVYLKLFLFFLLCVGRNTGDHDCSLHFVGPTPAR